MPIVDMPLEKLVTYQGVNPKPSDFEEYWTRALAAMHALGTAHERVLSAFQAPGVTFPWIYGGFRQLDRASFLCTVRLCGSCTG